MPRLTKSQRRRLSKQIKKAQEQKIQASKNKSSKTVIKTDQGTRVINKSAQTSSNIQAIQQREINKTKRGIEDPVTKSSRIVDVVTDSKGNVVAIKDEATQTTRLVKTQTTQQKPKVITDQQGTIVGIEDPRTKQSTQISKNLQTVSRGAPSQTKGTLTAVKDTTALRRAKNPVNQFFQGVTKGFGFQETIERRGKTTPRGAGAFLGNILGIASAGSIETGANILGKGVATAKATRVGQTAQRVTKAVQSSKIGNFALGTGQVIGKGIIGTVIGTKATETLTTTPLQREILKDLRLKGIRGQAFEEEAKALAQGGVKLPGGASVSLKSVAFEVSPFLSSRKDVFEKSVRRQLKERGFQGPVLEETAQAISKQRTAVSVGEATGLITSGAGSEAFGRSNVARAFSKGFQTTTKDRVLGINTKIFKRTFVPIAQAGFAEGVTQEVLQQQTREQPRNIKKALTLGGLGAVTAGTVGGIIAGSRVTSPGLSKVVETGSFIADPFEKPGDILQDVFESANKRITGRTPKRAQIVTTISPSSIINVGTTTPTTTRTPTTVPVKTQTPINPIQNILGISTNPVTSPVKTPTNAVVPSTVPVDIPIQSPVQTPTNPNVPIPINTDVPVPVPVNVPVNIPVTTPIFKFPPPVPFGFDLSGGFGGSRGTRKRSKFVNELAFGKGLFNQLTGVNINNNTKRKNNSFNINKLVFG